MVKEQDLAEINGLIGKREHIYKFHDGGFCPMCKKDKKLTKADSSMLFYIAFRLEELGVEPNTDNRDGPSGPGGKRQGLGVQRNRRSRNKRDKTDPSTAA